MTQGGSWLGVLTLLVAVLVAYIAFQQWLVSRAKLKLDLFERRLKIYEATQQYILQSIAAGPPEQSDFLSDIARASFLFGSDIEHYMGEVLDARAKLRAIVQHAAGNGGVVRSEDVDLNFQLNTWLGEEWGDKCRKRFAPYLDFSSWR